MADIITRLLLDTKNFDAKLDRSKSSVNSFQGGISNMAKTAGAGVLKFAGTLGIAMGAGEAFNRVLNSSQELGDMTARNMAALKTSVDDFFYSLGSGEFSSFLSGLGDIIDKAKDAHSALDQLGNTKISHSYFSAENESKIAGAQYVAKNKFAPLEDRVKAFEDWRVGLESQGDINKTLQHDLIKAITTSVESEIGATKLGVTMDDVRMALKVDVTNPLKRDELKSQYSAEYKEYRKKVSKLDAAYQHFDKNGNITDDIKGEYRLKTQTEKDNELTRLNEKYREAIVINAMLNKYEDEELTTIANMAIEYRKLDSALASTSREYNETANEFNNANKAVKGFTAVASLEGYKVYSGSPTPTGIKPTKPAPAGSIAILNEQITTKNKELLNATTVQARAEIQKTIDELEARKISLNIATEKEVFRDKYGENKLDATKAQKQFSEYINVDKEISAKSKELTNATTEQARVAVQKTISELEEKKIKLKVSIEKEIQTNSVDSKTKKDFSEYVSVEEDISKQNTQLINTTTEQARIAVQSTINEFEAKKIQIGANVSLKPDLSSEMAGVLNDGSKDQKGNQKTKGSSSTDISGVKLPKIKTITDTLIDEYIAECDVIDKKINAQIAMLPKAKSDAAKKTITNTIKGLEKEKLDSKLIKQGKIKSPVSQKDVKTLEEYQDNLYGISDAMRLMSGVMGEGAASWLNWGASLLSTISQGIPAIRDLVKALQAKAAGEAIAGASSAGPFGWIAAGAAVASIIASFASIPKFANGGIIEGNSTFGDMNLARVNAGEMILNGMQQSNLFRLLDGGYRMSANNGGTVSFKIHGRDLEGVLRNHTNQKNKVR